MTSRATSTGVPALRGEARREQILDLAEEILEADGIDALTMRRLADGAGIRAPSLYKHWRDKEALLAGLQERALRAFATEMAGAGNDLHEIGRRYRAWANAHPALYSLVARRPLARDRLTPGVEDSAASPVLAAVSGDENRARALWAAAHGLVDLELAERFPPGADLGAAWTALVDAFQPKPHPAIH